MEFITQQTGEMVAKGDGVNLVQGKRRYKRLMAKCYGAWQHQSDNRVSSAPSLLSLDVTSNIPSDDSWWFTLWTQEK